MSASNPHKHLFILTGASRGMGLAMAQQLLLPDHVLLTLSRHIQGQLGQQAVASGAELTQWSADLTDGAAVAAHLAGWLADIPPECYAGASLINNAGVIPAIVPLRGACVSELAQALRVGLEAPMLLTSAFLRATSGWAGQRKVLNVSSGLGHKAMASQAAYCAAKAGMDHFTRCLAMEEAQRPNGARVCSLAPGVIDTDMQVQLRSAAAADFPARGNFEQLHKDGQLSSPADAARRVLAYLARPDFGTQPVADVRESV